MEPTTRPILFVDVDGPLNPYAAKPHRRPDGYRTHHLTPPNWIAHLGGPSRQVKPLRVWLNPSHGSALLELAAYFDLVWATTWEHDANSHIAPLLGLPELPVVEFTGSARSPGPEGTFFKTVDLIAYAAGRPFAWVDDDIRDTDRRYLDRNYPAATLPQWVDPAIGLTDINIAALADWATQPTD
ncbi:HAD domain-containing protein [Nocardia stercoris]|uniref:Secreted protein n=1 Tax=Nocardia stercoris TaxID=2483361 RepID=A0A3M2L8Y3_9NOCA|nr:HAD domain-containing protein [Nocardia stercoris]RMI33516.1 hypothetical protein EBN03_10370 [Nocardia stercoris]